MYLKLNQRLEMRKIVDNISFWIKQQNEAINEKNQDDQKIAYYRSNIMTFQDQLITFLKNAISEIKIK